MDVSLCYSVQSHVGFRTNNEDGAYSGPHLLALADGMGGHAAGEVAASLVISELIPLDRQEVEDPLVALRQATRRCNQALGDHIAAHPEHRGMGTTLTALLFGRDSLGLVHVGDSRAYLMREGFLSQITKDDTLVQHLVDEGRITAEEAWGHPQRSMVSQVLTGESVDPLFETFQVQPNDRYLICSDGLTDYAPTERILDALQMVDPQRCTQQLIRLALQHGSRDNITCIVADAVGGASGYNIALRTGAVGRGGVLVA